MELRQLSVTRIPLTRNKMNRRQLGISFIYARPKIDSRGFIFFQLVTSRLEQLTDSKFCTGGAADSGYEFASIFIVTKLQAETGS